MTVLDPAYAEETAPVEEPSLRHTGLASHLRGVLVLAACFVTLAMIGWIVWSFASGPSAGAAGLGQIGSSQYYVPPTIHTVAPLISKDAPARRHASDLVSTAWVAKVADETGIPATAVAAYGHAQLAEPASCHLGWTSLAGIGEIESGHGTGQGATLHSDGMSLPTITSSAGAMGPMQFIASTWDRWATDGDGDGYANIDDINDAAMTAMRYLCSYGDLSTGSAWSRAIFAYNHSDSYVTSVYDAAETYAEETAHR